MTVRELIYILEDLHPDLPVKITSQSVPGKFVRLKQEQLKVNNNPGELLIMSF